VFTRTLRAVAPTIADVELYRPLSSEEVERLERGEGFGETAYYFVDKPDPDEAAADAVWVIIEIPEEDALPFEDPSATDRGYREFALPGQLATRFPVRRALHL
jgi:hypothetical protein